MLGFCLRLRKYAIRLPREMQSDIRNNQIGKDAIGGKYTIRDCDITKFGVRSPLNICGESKSQIDIKDNFNSVYLGLDLSLCCSQYCLVPQRMLKAATRINTQKFPINKVYINVFHPQNTNIIKMDYQSKRYVSRTNTKKNIDTSVITISNSTAGANNEIHTKMSKTSPLQSDDINMITSVKPDYKAYLKTLPKGELFSLAMIGICSLNKTMLNLCIKMFPWVPMPLIKLLIGKLYCGGDTMKDVVKCGEALQKRNISNMMLSLTIENSEGNKKNIDINYIVDETIRSIHNVLKPNLLSQLENPNIDCNSVAPGYIALKPSALVDNPNEILSNFANTTNVGGKKQLIDNCSRVAEEVFNLNKSLSKRFPDRVAPFFVCTIDAEKYDWQLNGVYPLQRLLMSKYNKFSPDNGNNMISVVSTWQLYLKDSLKHLEDECESAKSNNYKIGAKIVRGAYIHSEKNRENIIFNTKSGTDRNYNDGMKYILKSMVSEGKDKSPFGHLVVASHNYESELLATRLSGQLDNPTDSKHQWIKSNVVIGQLLGMADNIAFDLVQTYKIKNLIKYVPWGPPLETKDYLLRRLQENSDAVRVDNGWPLLKNVLQSVFK